MNYKDYKETYLLYSKKAPWQSLAMAFSFVMVIIAVVILDYLFVGSIILTIPFVLIPYLLCLQIGLVRVRMTGEVKPKEFYRPFLVAFQENIFRIYRPLKMGLFAFGVYLISSVITTLIGYWIVQSYVPALKAIFDELMTIAQSSQTLDYETIMIFLEDNQVSFAPFFSLIYAISMGMAYLFLTLNTVYHAFLVNFALSIPARADKILSIHKRVFPALRRTYLGYSFKNLYPALIVFVVGYLVGSGLAFILRPSDPFLSVIVGVMFSSLLLMPFIPKILISNEVLFEIMMPVYLKETDDSVKKVYTQFAQSQDLTEAQKEEIQRLLDMMDPNAPKVDDQTNEDHNDDSQDHEEE
ncbi:MAG: hypothetical protein EOM74_02045 [Methanomicrobia archaeon]|nr:hypothetical protein [Methanomicrobia archaeon]